MALFRLAAEPTRRVRGEGLELRAPRGSDHAQWAALRAESRTFLEPWEPAWPADDLSRGAFRRRIRRYEDEAARDEAYPFFVVDGEGRLLGGLTLGQVRRGVAQAATLGYWMGASHAGRGVMTRAVAAACAFGFEQLRLHRIEAACIPGNEASARVLAKNRFREEGLARAYLRIDGRWRDHRLFARLEGD